MGRALLSPRSSRPKAGNRQRRQKPQLQCHPGKCQPAHSPACRLRRNETTLTASLSYSSSTLSEWVAEEHRLVISLEMRQHIGVYPAAGCVRNPTAVPMATRCSGTSLPHHRGFPEPFPDVSGGLLSRGHSAEAALTEYPAKDSGDSGTLKLGNFAKTKTGQSAARVAASLAGQGTLYRGGTNLVQENKVPLIMHLR